MPKKCIICNEGAAFCVKDTSDFYCKECAEESFGDLSLLIAIEEQAKDIALKYNTEGKLREVEKIIDNIKTELKYLEITTP